MDPPSLFFVNCEKTRAPRGTDRSPEYNEHFCYKLDSRVKYQSVFEKHYNMPPAATKSKKLFLVSRSQGH